MDAKSESIIAELSGHHIHVDREHIQRYAVDGNPPVAVVEAGDTEQISELLQQCNRYGSKVNTRGGGSHQELGGILSPVDIALDVSGLCQILETEPENLSVTVQCGVRLDDLQTNLAEHGLFLPLNPPHLHATLGGLVSVNAYGSWCQGYGTLRDLMLGGRAILADGTDIRFGGKTVKNVAGYDMAKLFIGALGTLGVLTQMTFKVYPIPERVIRLRIPFGFMESFTGLQQCVLASDLPISEFTLKSMGNIPGYAAVIGLNCREQETTVYRDKLDQLVNGAGEIDILDWNAYLTGQPVIPVLPDEGSMVLKWTVPLSRFQDVVERIENNLTGTDYVLYGYPGRGVLYAATLDTGLMGRFHDHIADWRIFAHELEGRLVLSKAPVRFKMGIPVWDIPVRELQWHERIKKEFDPHSVFAPGRFIDHEVHA